MQEPVGEPRARVAARRWLVAAVAVALVTAAQLLRQSGARTWDTIWAEDGRVYASDALGGSWATSLLRGYAGYVQVVPRLLALPLRVLPPSWWAAWLAVSAALVTSLLALYVYRAVGSYLASNLLRALLAITAAVSPAMWFEVNANVANLGWPLLFAAFWALLDRRTTRGAVVARSVVLAAAALTSTLAALYLPLALLIAWRRRRGAEICVTAIFGVALAVQVVADRFTAPGASGPASVGEIVKLYLVRVLGSATVGDRYVRKLWLSWHLWAAAAFAVVVVVVVVVGHRAASRERRAMWVAGVASVVLFAAPVWVRGTDAMRLGAEYTPGGSRYVVVPALLVSTAIVFAAQATGRRLVHCLAAAQLIAIVVSSLWLPNARNAGPRWHSNLDAAVAACATRASDDAVAIQTTPDEPIWYVETTCGRIR